MTEPGAVDSPAEALRGRAPLATSTIVLAGVLLLSLLLLQPQPINLPLADDFATASAAVGQPDSQAAADALTDAAERLWFSGDVAWRAAQADLSARQFDSAIQQIQRSAALDGWTPAKQVALGDAYLGSGDRARALEQWELARSDLPNDDGLLARLAATYEVEGRYADAIEALVQLAQLRGGDATVLYRLALLTAATAPEQASARIALAVDLVPDLAPKLEVVRQAVEAGQASGDEAYAFGRVGFALIQMKEWALAELALNRATTVNPSFADAWAYLGLAQDMLGHDGEPSYKAAVQLAPQSPLPLFLLGLHWRRLGQSSSALTYLRQAQALDPQNPAIAAEMGGAYASIADLPNAEVWFTQAVSLAPQSLDFWLLLARFYIDNEYHVAEYGLPAALTAVGLNPESALAQDTLGYALVLTDNLSGGQKLLERAIVLNPDLASAHFHLGMVFLKQQNFAEAEVEFNRALALDPDGPYGGMALKALARLPE